MFGGLELKGSPKTDAEPPSSLAAPSSFSFMHSSSSENQKPSDPSSSSAFGFLSNFTGPAITADSSAMAASEESVTASQANASSMYDGLQTSITSNGFSFMSGPTGSAKNKLDDGSTVSATGSSFSFLSSTITTSSNGCISSNYIVENETVETNKKLTLGTGQDDAHQSTAPTHSGDLSSISAFSFIPISYDRVSAPSTTNIINQTPSSLTTPEKVASPSGNVDHLTSQANSDLLSLSNPGLPTGAGVSWSNPSLGTGIGVKKKMIKKRVGTARVGVSASLDGGTGSNFDIPLSTETINRGSHLIDVPAPPPSLAATPTLATPNPSVINQSTESPPMREKAEQANHNAEQFIREKQRSAIAMAAERAMIERSSSQSADVPVVPSDGGNVPLASNNVSSSTSGWKISNPSPFPSDSSVDMTYQAAKAAAQEARKIGSSTVSKTKASLFSGFFNRGRSTPTFANGGPNESISSYSAHGGVIGRVGSSNPVLGGGGDDCNSNTLSPMKEIEDFCNPHESEESLYSTAMISSIDSSSAQKEQEYQSVLEKKTVENKEDESQLDIERERMQMLEEERIHRLEEEAAAKCQTPREKMNAILDQFAHMVRLSTDRIHQLSEDRLKLIKDRSEAEKNHKLASQQLSDAEGLLTKAAEEEDFEVADHLALVIEQYTIEMKEQSKVLNTFDKSIEELDHQRNNSSKAVEESFQEVILKLKELEEEQKRRCKEDGTEVLDQFAVTMKRLSSENERLNNDLKIIVRDEELVAEEKKDLEDRIAVEAKDFEEKRTEASEKLAAVNEKIEDLRKQLIEAELEAATHIQEISKQEESINTIRGKFARQLGRIGKKEQSVKENRLDWEAEKKTLEKSRAAHEAVMEAHSENLLSMDKLLDDISFEVSQAKFFEDVLSRQDIQHDLNFGEKNLVSLESEILKCKADVNEANKSVIYAEAQIEEFQVELARIQDRVPLLEAEKKNAALNRDFKTAGKVSKEIKNAIARKEEIEAELIGKALEHKIVAKNELSKAISKLDEITMIAAREKKEVGLKQMALLNDEVKRLQMILKEVNETKKGTLDSMNVASIGSFVIESKISILEADGESLEKLYGHCDSSATLNDDQVNICESGPSFDSSAENFGVEINDSIIERFAALNLELSNLEAAIIEAVEMEDFEEAAELEEKANRARNAVKALGVTTEALESELMKKLSIDKCKDSVTQANVGENEVQLDERDTQSAHEVVMSGIDDNKDEDKYVDQSVPSNDEITHPLNIESTVHINAVAEVNEDETNQRYVEEADEVMAQYADDHESKIVNDSID